MASLDISPDVGRAYQKLVSSPPAKSPSPTHAQWAVFAVSAPLQNAFVQTSKGSTLKVQSTGEGELDELIQEEFNDGKVQFAFVKVKDANAAVTQNSAAAKYVLICWQGEGVPERVKGYFQGHLNAVTKVCHGYHVQVTARSESDLSAEDIVEKVRKASGSNYSAATSGAAPTPAPKPAVATKPVFTPTRVTGTANLPVGSRAPFRRDEKTDTDGWGADAPPVNRSTIEKVAPAYKKTVVDINALKAGHDSTTSGGGNASEDQEVVKGGYQPIGKVDIAALRKGYKEERPAPVKGSYEPVNTSNIRKAPAPEPEAPKPVADRMSAFTQQNTQSERLTSLPKPKVANKFGSGAANFGTKPLAPGGFGSSPAPPPATVGAINKTGITKSPAQIWAEKKARERGLSGASETTPPTQSPMSTGQALDAQRTGASTASQQEQEEERPSGGISALRNKFSGAPPMGAPQSPQRTGGFSGDRAPPSPRQPSPPPVDTSSRPGGMKLPGFPPRPAAEEEDETTAAGIPPPPPQPPRSPTPPTPEVPGSPVRIAMPVAREEPEEELVSHHEPEPPVALPAASMSQALGAHEDVPEEEPVRERTAPAAGGAGAKAKILYDYEAAEDNEISLIDGQIVTDIEMVDDDWWAGVNSAGQHGLFPSNYVELVADDDDAAAEDAAPPPPPPAATRPAPEPEAEAEPEPEQHQAEEGAGHKAEALYDYEAAEENEISFPEGAVIENIQFPDDDWWAGTYKGKEGLFPANYVQLIEH